MLVTYTYHADEQTPSEKDDIGGTSRTKETGKPETKSFAFYTVVDLGPIIPRVDVQVHSRSDPKAEL